MLTAMSAAAFVQFLIFLVVVLVWMPMTANATASIIYRRWETRRADRTRPDH